MLIIALSNTLLLYVNVCPEYRCICHKKLKIKTNKLCCFLITFKCVIILGTNKTFDKDNKHLKSLSTSLCLYRLESPSYEVMQLDFEVDNVINLVPTQTLHWTVEYPAGTQTASRQTEKVSHLYISNADIQGIVPLAEVRDNSLDVKRSGIPHIGTSSHFFC